MKINDVNRVQGLNKYRKLDRREEELKQQGQKKDQVVISNEAKALLEQTKATHQQRVQEVKEQIDSGTYRVDTKKVADKMLEWFKNN